MLDVYGTNYLGAGAVRLEVGERRGIDIGVGVRVDHQLLLGLAGRVVHALPFMTVVAHAGGDEVGVYATGAVSALHIHRAHGLALHVAVGVHVQGRAHAAPGAHTQLLLQVQYVRLKHHVRAAHNGAVHFAYRVSNRFAFIILA
jgi:hypothetical protein